MQTSFSPAAPAVRLPSRRGPKPVKSAAAFEALKRAIMLGRIPPGDWLIELDLAERFNCSQGTIREALLQLQEEGLVRRLGHRGTCVSACAEDEAIEMFRLRRQIEAIGIARALAKPSPDLIADLTALIAAMEVSAEAGDEIRLAAEDRDFHRRLFRDADLPAMEPILHRCLVHNHRFKISNANRTPDLMVTARRHTPIVAAIEQRDLPRASAVLDHHIATIIDFGPKLFPQTEAG